MKFVKLSSILRKALVFVIYLLTYSLYSVEIILTNGDIFIADYVREDSKNLTIQWKSELYQIPKSEILKMDLTKVGQNKSFRPVEFALKDGSKVKGIILEKEQTYYTLKTELGFLKLENSKIAEISGEGKEDFPPPKTFNDYKITKNYTNLGLSGTGSTIDSSISEYYKNSRSVGIFLEPASTQINSRFRFGFQLESNVSNREKNESFVQLYNRLQTLQAIANQTYQNYFFYNYFKEERNRKLEIQTFLSYLQFRWNPNRWVDVFCHLGVGVSNLHFSENNQSGFLPSTLIQFGYQGFSFDRILIRLSVKSISIFDKGNSLRLDGGEFSLGYAI